ncbi:MAG TPA: hypothetical protein VF723_07330 [Pyrinomonadaceae bacterium]|jgi:hypothetical protein
MFNGIRQVRTAEGEKYELNYDGKTKLFDTRQEVDYVLALHMAKDAGRQLTPEEESQLLTAEPTKEQAKSASE